MLKSLSRRIQSLNRAAGDWRGFFRAKSSQWVSEDSRGWVVDQSQAGSTSVVNDTVLLGKHKIIPLLTYPHEYDCVNKHWKKDLFKPIRSLTRDQLPSILLFDVFRNLNSHPRISLHYHLLSVLILMQFSFQIIPYLVDFLSSVDPVAFTACPLRHHDMHVTRSLLQRYCQTSRSFPGPEGTCDGADRSRGLDCHCHGPSRLTGFNGKAGNVSIPGSERMHVVQHMQNEMTTYYSC